MKLGTLCYITDGKKTLMLHRVKKENDMLNSPKRRLPDVSKAIGLTKYKLQYSLEDGLNETFQWYKKNVFNNNKILNSYN